MSQAINFVFVDCQPEIEKEYNDWYNTVHIPMIMKYDGILRTTRYKLLTGPQGQARYFTVYEFKDREAMDSFPKSLEYAAVDAELHQTWKGKEFEIKLAAQYEAIKTWSK